MPLIPRDRAFYPLFGEQVAIVAQGTRVLETMLRDYALPEAQAAELRALEHHGDELNHRIVERLEQTFVTPFGREEIHDLAARLDEVLDQTEEAADLLVLYRLEGPPAGAADQASLLVRQGGLLEEAIACLPSPSRLKPFVVQLHALEKDGDQLLRTVIQRLFDLPPAVPVLLAALDVHRKIESAIDASDHVGQVLDRVALQYAGPW